MEEIKKIVTEKEMEKIDRVIAKLQSLFTWIFYLFSLFARYLDS